MGETDWIEFTRKNWFYLLLLVLMASALIWYLIRRFR